jgi:hypothetical protein
MKIFHRTHLTDAVKWEYFKIGNKNEENKNIVV